MLPRRTERKTKQKNGKPMERVNGGYWRMGERKNGGTHKLEIWRTEVLRNCGAGKRLIRGAVTCQTSKKVTRLSSGVMVQGTASQSFGSVLECWSRNASAR